MPCVEAADDPIQSPKRNMLTICGNQLASSEIKTSSIENKWKQKHAQDWSLAELIFAMLIIDQNGVWWTQCVVQRGLAGVDFLYTILKMQPSDTQCSERVAGLISCNATFGCRKFWFLNRTCCFPNRFSVAFWVAPFSFLKRPFLNRRSIGVWIGPVGCWIVDLGFWVAFFGFWSGRLCLLGLLTKVYRQEKIKILGRDKIV